MLNPTTKTPLKSLITGAGGQSAYWLAKDLTAHGRQVFRCSSQGLDLKLPYGDAAGIWRVLSETQPEEIYHLACPSQLIDSLEFERGVFQMSVDVVLVMLRWIEFVSPETRFFFASSCEIFGTPADSPQNEATPPNPEHPYAVAKLAGQKLVKHFRDFKHLYAVTGILYNHESHLRRSEFVSQKIARAVAEIHLKKASVLELGNLNAVRDWSHAADFATGFRLSLEAPEPDDYIFASGIARTVKDFCRIAFSSVGLDWSLYVTENPAFFRPDCVPPRIGNPEKAKQTLGWNSERTFEDWVGEMVRIQINQCSE